MSQYNFAEYGVFDSPKKTIYSPFHKKMFVMGDHTVYSFDPSTLTKLTVQTSEEGVFSDIDVSEDGYLLVLIKPFGVGIAVIKVLSPDLFSLAYESITNPIPPFQWLFTKGVFAQLGKAVVAGELISVPVVGEGPGMSSSSISSSSSSISSGVAPVHAGSSSSSKSSQSSGHSANAFRLYVIDYLKNTTEIIEQKTSGEIVGMSYDPLLNQVLSVTSNGDVLKMSESGAVVDVGGMNVTVTAVAFGRREVKSTSPVQSAVRIYVGSKPWASDRWDSGEVATSASGLSYGGGDNLVPGQKYWVHIMVKTSGTWSAPQIQQFVVPKE